VSQNSDLTQQGVFAELDAARRALAAKDAEIERLRAQLADIERSHAGCAKAMESGRELLAGFEKTVKDLCARLAEWDGEIERLRVKVKDLNSARIECRDLWHAADRELDAVAVAIGFDGKDKDFLPAIKQRMSRLAACEPVIRAVFKARAETSSGRWTEAQAWKFIEHQDMVLPVETGKQGART